MSILTMAFSSSALARHHRHPNPSPIPNPIPVSTPVPVPPAPTATPTPAPVTPPVSQGTFNYLCTLGPDFGIGTTTLQMASDGSFTNPYFYCGQPSELFPGNAQEYVYPCDHNNGLMTVVFSAPGFGAPTITIWAPYSVTMTCTLQ